MHLFSGKGRGGNAFVSLGRSLPCTAWHRQAVQSSAAGEAYLVAQLTWRQLSCLVDFLPVLRVFFCFPAVRLLLLAYSLCLLLCVPAPVLACLCSCFLACLFVCLLDCVLRFCFVAIACSCAAFFSSFHRTLLLLACATRVRVYRH